MMTKKDYELIAATISGFRPPIYSDDGSGATRRYMAQQFADALATTSPKFDRERFLRACQPESVRGSR